ncbi:unnamed protein product, partial [Prorocentrum cordatum]
TFMGMALDPVSEAPVGHTLAFEIPSETEIARGGREEMFEVLKSQEMPAASVEHLAGLYGEFELPAAYTERSSACEASLVEMLAQAPGCAGGGRARSYSQPLAAWPQSTRAVSTCDVVSEADSIALQGWRQSMPNPESVAAELRDALGIDRPRVDPELRFQPNSRAQFSKQLEAVSKGVFTGLQIDGLSGIIRHCTWGVILRRNVLAISNSVYRFINVVGAQPAPLWASVVRDLRAPVALLPPGVPLPGPMPSRPSAHIATSPIVARMLALAESTQAALLRRLSGIALACGLRALVRRAPSERKVADKPSREGFFVGPSFEHYIPEQKPLSWRFWTARGFESSAELDAVLVAHFAHLFLGGYDGATGRATLAALKHHNTALLIGNRPLPRAFRALQGRAKLAPLKMRLPLPRVAMFAIAGALLPQGRLAEATFARIAFAACLRPSEAYRLAAASLIAPRIGASVEFGDRVEANFLQLMEEKARAGIFSLQLPPLPPAPALPAARSAPALTDQWGFV